MRQLPPNAPDEGVGLSLPNLISLGRLLLVPLAIWLILGHRYGAAFWIFIVAGISDALDGFIAKHFDRRTRLGALLDPIADKALLVSVYVTLGLANQLWPSLVILVVFRDVMIVGGFLLIQAFAVPKH
ncbi:MAG: CDP-alcohol phosphatidyltransferase family protein, partial [Alphaproteobacteria bacterium]|nr:CDP-alcohol phosphatidyltransferase family protein [Alphaproteobacteria bacterium]